MISTTVVIDAHGIPERLLAASRGMDLTPAMRQVASSAEGFVRNRVGSGRAPDGSSHAPLYPKPENLGRTPLFRTGKLKGSIRSTSTADEARIGSPLLHARILHLGGRTSAHPITARRARMLSWVAPAAERIFARSVDHPGSNIPARPIFGLSPLELLRVKTVFSVAVERSLRSAGL